MSNSNNNQLNTPQAREAMDRFKMQGAQEVNGHLTSREAGSIGVQLIKGRVSRTNSKIRKN